MFGRKKLPFSALHCQQLVYKSDWENALCIKDCLKYNLSSIFLKFGIFKVHSIRKKFVIFNPVFNILRVLNTWKNAEVYLLSGHSTARFLPVFKKCHNQYLLRLELNF